MPTLTRLKSGSWRVQVRRKGKYVNNTFLRRKDAEEWALETERRIDRGEPSIARREAKTFGDLVRLHRADLQEVGKRFGRSKSASLTFLERRLGQLRLSELDRERNSERNALERAPVRSPWELISDTSRQSCATLQPFTGSLLRRRALASPASHWCNSASSERATSETGGQHRMSSTASLQHSI